MLHYEAGPSDVAAGDARKGKVSGKTGQMGPKGLAVGNAVANQDTPFRR